jgi:mannan endo-1,4-beta-mannosidase
VIAYISRVAFVILLTILSTKGVTQTFEAESAALSGTQTATQRTGYSGSGYVTGFDSDGDKATFSFSSQGGIHDLFIRYAAPFGPKSNFVYVNGENVGSVHFPESTAFTVIRVGKIFLRKGSNTLAVVKDWGYFELDQIRVAPSPPSAIDNIATTLVVPTSTKRADSLYQLLSKVYGKAILSGQYGGTSELEHIQNVSGKTPVIRGFDLIDYSPSRVERGATSTETEKAIAWDKERGVVTFCWHWNAPKDLIDQPGKEWWRGFYSDATNFDLTKAMNNEASEEYGLIIRDIDAIAAQLKKLAAADVPVLWRPLHEAEGKWFWWGAKGPEACKWLWKLLFQRLVDGHGLRNLIWIWTSTGTPDALNWYPGDQYVDIVGADIYLPAGTYTSSLITFDNMASLYGGRKIIALSENGPIPDPDNLFQERAAWSWFSTWSGDFITGGSSNTNTHINKVYNHEYVITLDEIDRIDEIIFLLEEKRETDVETPVTGIESEGNQIFLQNPFEHKLVVRTPPWPMLVEIFDLQGSRQFAPRYMTEGECEFDFSSKASGVYLLRMTGNGSVRTYRVVKQ